MAEPQEGRGHTRTPTVQGYEKPGKHFQVTVDATPADNDLASLIGAALTTIFPGSATDARRLPNTVYILPENGDIRFRDDGTDPSIAAVGAAGVGYPIFNKSEYRYTGDLESIKLAAAAATLVSLYFVYA